MKNFITNSNKDISLEARLKELLSVSKELKFLVGFFYFSGLDVLYDSLKNNNDVTLKILVGLDVDVINHQLIEYPDKVNKNSGLSNEQIYNNLLASIRKSINTEDFDEEYFYKQINFFIDLIKNDRLIIRKTKNPNHAKLYILKLNKEQHGCNKLFITGSSNLTKPD